MELDRVPEILQKGASISCRSSCTPAQPISHVPQSETTLPTDPAHAAKHSLPKADPKWHGDSGPILKSYPLYLGFGSLQENVIKAAEEVGVPFNPDAVRTAPGSLGRYSANCLVSIMQNDGNRVG